jgi:hypothetical protein
MYLTYSKLKLDMTMATEPTDIPDNLKETLQIYKEDAFKVAHDNLAKGMPYTVALLTSQHEHFLTLLQEDKFNTAAISHFLQLQREIQKELTSVFREYNINRDIVELLSNF